MDGRSGVNPGAIAPSSVVDMTWTQFGSDVAEERKYTISNHAGNTLDLGMKIKCLPNEYEINVVKLDHNGENVPHPPQLNSIYFRRVLGAHHPLLAVKQLIGLGRGDARKC
jgi:hypothetical protein